jgi:ribosome biogenesis GTPase
VAALAVLTKADLCADPQARLAELHGALPDLPAVALDATGDAPLAQLTDALGTRLQLGCTLVLLGSSGAGKSTLTNLLLGHERQRTGANRRGDQRGRHTTTARSLHLTPTGACIIDTPGLRTLRLDSEAGQIDTVFGDIAALASHCRFGDCQHRAEPGCAVREQVTPERLANFQKLTREARSDERSALERQTVVAQWKARSRAARARTAAKRG